MSYSVMIFRNEVSQNTNPEFLENQNLITDFSSEEYLKLKDLLLKYGYQIESEKDSIITFNYKGGKMGIEVILFKNQLSFNSGFDQDGLFEVMQTSSEFVSKEFAKYDPQTNEWEVE